jgi:alanine racemase
MRATRASIHLDNFERNIAKIRAHVGPTPRILLPVKADAYGHGAERMSIAGLAAGASHLAVACADEGEALRACGIDAPILILSLAMPEEFRRIAEAGLEPLCADMKNLLALEAAAESAGRRVTVHVKVDTGMGRIGCAPEEAAALAEYAARSTRLALGGICTHFPASDSEDPDDVAFTRSQFDAFSGIVAGLRRRGIDPGLASCANSGAVLQFPEMALDMVRPGILSYGYYPAPLSRRPFEVEPVMEFLSKVVFLKRLPAGRDVSYGRTWRTSRETVIATLPVGYADGYPRALSNKGQVLIRGKRYPIVGRICMDQCMADLGPEPEAELYDDAVLFGPQAQAPDAQDVADACGTIAYEITCNINKRVPRLYAAS